MECGICDALSAMSKCVQEKDKIVSVKQLQNYKTLIIGVGFFKTVQKHMKNIRVYQSTKFGKISPLNTNYNIATYT